MKKLLLIGLLLAFSFQSQIASSNNVTVSNTSLVNQNTTSDYWNIEFDITWENSWRMSDGPSNWDAVWIFVKYRNNGSNWKHATINVAGYTAPSGSAIDVADDTRGAFLYRSADGSGTFTLTEVRLQWDYGLDGVSSIDNIEIKLMAIEMVYIPEGAFDLGSGGSEEEYAFFEAGTSHEPYHITSEDALNIGSTSGYLTADNHLVNDPLPAAFPKGYQAFYIMKYETSQAQYVDFLNLLTDAQADENQDGISSSEISGSSAGSYVASNPCEALGELNYFYGAAYADWSGLRHMTEFEFEKACRGTVTAVADEYAWGNSTVTTTTYTYADEDDCTETITNLPTNTGNCIYYYTETEARRCGVIAASSSTHSRQDAGGTYYGVMDMSGNLSEPCIDLGKADNFSFQGHGDGSIGIDGVHTVATWPIESPKIAFKGGSFNNAEDRLRVSDRELTYDSGDANNTDQGFRGVRTAD